MTWKGIVGLNYSANEFDKYCHGLSWTAWRPSFVTLHNTASPTLADRPKGLTKTHILNLEAFYHYNTESFDADRGLAVQENAVAAFATLHAVLGLDPDTIKLHKEDKCTHHDCPGKNVKKKAFIQKVKDLMEKRHGGGHLDAVA